MNKNYMSARRTSKMLGSCVLRFPAPEIYSLPVSKTIFIWPKHPTFSLIIQRKTDNQETWLPRSAGLVLLHYDVTFTDIQDINLCCNYSFTHMNNQSKANRNYIWKKYIFLFLQIRRNKISTYYIALDISHIILHILLC